MRPSEATFNKSPFRDMIYKIRNLDIPRTSRFALRVCSAGESSHSRDRCRRLVPRTEKVSHRKREGEPYADLERRRVKRGKQRPLVRGQGALYDGQRGGITGASG